MVGDDVVAVSRHSQRDFGVFDMDVISISGDVERETIRAANIDLIAVSEDAFAAALAVQV